ncbi:MAG TPA: 16S rRNA (uracil(1498)-N(3))-methyltransferase [Candidatus Omnitrophota bacterium]|nr:16S rRNA (uracil(1498)-N(3))-methyltransferase [Candidatus Omnitrophota bacterium]HPN87782.1 16S rRNA (uracil(1498)-N(3))-methyltransferase [Candidatus Omnitrophota bacterium]
MNLILLQKTDFLKTKKTRAHLTGRRQKHVLEIHKAKLGDELCVGVMNGKIGKGKVVFLNADTLELDVTLFENPPEKLPVTLALALPRPIMLKRILSTVTTLGIKELILFNSWRVEKSFWNSSIFKGDEITEQISLGLEQARDTVFPKISFRRYFSAFVKNEVPKLVDKKLALLGHPQAQEICPRNVKQETVLFIGPEGGFIPSEIDALIASGVKPVSLGKRILRVETAIDVLLGRLF